MGIAGGVGVCREHLPGDGAPATQKNELKPWKKKEWCIPKVSGEFVARMEDVLDLYQPEYNPERPVVCFDETSRQLTGEVRPPIEAAPGRVARYDTEYQRNGTRNLFMICEPKGGWRHVTRLIASSELKAIETAVCIANTTGLPIGISPEIDEVHRPTFVPDYEQLVRQFFNGQVPVDWESITEAQGRVQRFVASLARDATHEHVALVGHGLLWALARSWLLGQTRPNVEEWKAIAMPDFSSWNITDSGVVLTSEFQGIKEMG